MSASGPLEDSGAYLLATLRTADLHPGSASSLLPNAPEWKPTVYPQVLFGSGKSVETGNFFRASECKSAPSVSFTAEPDTASLDDPSYTLILADPDAPTPDDPKFAFWRHWVVSGLRAEGTEPADGKVLTEYLGPGPRDDSNPHRYLFMLYREPPGLSLSKDDVGGEEFIQRRSFKPAEWAERHRLALVGLNWMTCAGDGWVDR